VHSRQAHFSCFIIPFHQQHTSLVNKLPNFSLVFVLPSVPQPRSAPHRNVTLAFATNKSCKDSHSAGNFAVDEMLRKLQESGTTNAAVGTVTMFGSPVNAQNTSDKVNAVTSGQGTTKQATHVSDFVGTLFGGNAPTGGNPNSGALPAHSAYTGELTTSDKDTPQLPGVDVLPPEKIKELTNKSWGFSKPVIVPPSSKPVQQGETK
jgi:hypothetical protein